MSIVGMMKRLSLKLGDEKQYLEPIFGLMGPFFYTHALPDSPRTTILTDFHPLHQMPA
jgi:hypothetical protein